MPLRSSFVSSFNPSTNACLTSGVYGMQYWYVDYMWVYGGFFSGNSNNLRSYPGVVVLLLVYLVLLTKPKHINGLNLCKLKSNIMEDTFNK